MPAADILITAATVWRSSVGTARPYEGVGYGANWPNWTKLGMTGAPLTVNLEREKMNKMVEQALAKVGSVITGETLTLETTLAEFTMENLALSWPGMVTIQEAGAGQIPWEKLAGGNKICLATLQWGFEGLYQDDECALNLPLRFFCIGEAEMGGEVTFGKTEQTGIPLKIEASFDVATLKLYEWFKVTGVAL